MAVPSILLLLFLVCGVPLGISFALIVLTNPQLFNIHLITLSSVPYETIMSFPLLAIPLFLLVGEVMNHGGIAQLLIEFSENLLGRIKFRLGFIAIVACGLMGAITGSSVAAVSAIGSVMAPQMVARGYKREYGASVVAAAGLLGVLIPPSIPLIVYGATVGVSITDLFLATLLPGLFTAGAFAIVHAYLAPRYLKIGKEDRELKAKRQTKRAHKLRITSTLLLPIIILGGIYSGLFTPTEAAAVAAVYVIGLAAKNKSVEKNSLKKMMGDAALISGAVLCIIAFSSILNRGLILNGIPQSLADWAMTITTDKIVFLLIVNLVLFFVGMFIDTNTGVFLMGPMLAPAALKYGIDPVHFGIIVVVNIELGLITPPMAVNIYVAARTFKANIIKMMPSLSCYMLAALLILGLVTYVPIITIWFK